MYVPLTASFHKLIYLSFSFLSLSKILLNFSKFQHSIVYQDPCLKTKANKQTKKHPSFSFVLLAKTQDPLSLLLSFNFQSLAKTLLNFILLVKTLIHLP